MSHTLELFYQGINKYYKEVNTVQWDELNVVKEETEALTTMFVCLVNASFFLQVKESFRSHPKSLFSLCLPTLQLYV